jgi:hypothetical protein
MECSSLFSFITDFLQDLSVRYPKFQLTSAVRQMGPVFVAAYLLNPMIYFQDLYFIYKKKNSPLPSHR